MTDLAAKYRLQRALSWTSAARTFAGRSPDNEEKLAVKVISLAGDPQRESLTRRFNGTASVLHSLGHPTLPHVLDYGVTGAGEAFLVCEWFPGAPLSDLALDPGDVLSVVMQVVEALESLALHGLVHLGISPENVLVMPDRRAQLTGWGSSLLNVDWQSGQGVVLGVSNNYSAPELKQAGGIGEALWRADLYSIAKMTADLLGAEVSTASNNVQVRFPGELSRRISRPEALRSALEECLDPNPDRRPDSYSAFAKALQHAMPREQRADVTATQPMPKLRESVGVVQSNGANGANGATAATASSAAPLPPLPTPPAFTEASAAKETPARDPVPKSAIPEPPEPVAQKVDSEAAMARKTGVHAIRQQTGSFVLPKSSSEASALSTPMFEADELGKMIDDLAGEELIDEESAVESADSAHAAEAEASARDESKDEMVRESTTAEIAVPVVAMAPRDPSAPDPGLESLALVDESIDAASVQATADHGLPLKAGLDQEPDSEVATLWASPVARTELVKEAEKQHLSEPGPKTVLEELAAQSVGDLDKTALVSPPAEMSLPTEQAPLAEGSAAASSLAAKAKTVKAKSTRSAVSEDQGLLDEAGPQQAAASSKPPSVTVPNSHFRGKEGAAEASRPIQAPPPIASARGALEGRSRNRLMFGLVAAAILTLVLAGTLVAGLFTRAADSGDEPVMPRVADLVEVAETVEPALEQLPEELERLVILVAEGNWQDAVPLSQMLQERADQGELSVTDGDVLLSARQALRIGYGAELSARLGPALEALDVNEMRDALRGGATAMAALREQPGGSELASKARRVLRSVDAFRSALDRGQDLEPLDRALDLQEAYPALAERFDAIKRATNRVEQTTMALVDEGRLGEAASLVGEVGNKMELSPKLQVISDQISTRLQARAETAELLRTAEAFGQDGVPHRGLEILVVGVFNDETKERAAEIRLRLQAQLADLDQGQPQIDLVAESIDLKRGEPLVVELVVVDDYEVTDLSFEVVADGRPAQRLPVRAESDGHYSIQIPASLHQGKPVQFWATAVDRSGHRGVLGSREEPIEVRRKRWYQVFKRRGDNEG